MNACLAIVVCLLLGAGNVAIIWLGCSVIDQITPP
jgi:hypothetical protein